MIATGYELIFCIVNAGYSETVMTAATAAGSRGGTVMHARGTANREAEELFHISIQPDKDIVLLIVEREKRDDILHALYNNAGLSTAGQGIAFSVAVNGAVGLTKSDEHMLHIEEKDASVEGASDRETV